MVTHQDARHGPVTPRDRNRSREASSVVAAGKTRHSLQRAESRTGGNVRLSLHSEMVPMCRASSRSSYSASSVINNDAGPNTTRKTLVSQVLARHRVAAASAARYPSRSNDCPYDALTFFPSNIRFPRVCPKCLLNHKQLV